jgi:histone-lysine N-methyltransferase SETMAR
MAKRMEYCRKLYCDRDWKKQLDNLVTCDETWIPYTSHVKKRQWLALKEREKPTIRCDPHPRLALLSMWRNRKGVIHWELLPEGQTITANHYIEQLDRVAGKLRGKQDKVYYLHDNARPHVAKTVQDKLETLRWEVLPHPPYSPDLSPSDYHLFRSLNFYLGGRKFKNGDEMITNLTDFFDHKNEAFYNSGIYIHYLCGGNMYLIMVVHT